VSSSLASADFGGARLTDVTFDRCELGGAQVSQVTCERVDLRGARLDDLRGAGSLRGATVAPEQLIVLAPALAASAGLIVRPHDEQ
jgi:uncharacterized protein YjbI with pentapeptide repeats